MEYPRMNSEAIFTDIERRIRNNEFKSKEELSKYIIDLKDRGFLTQEEMKFKMAQLLGIYDELNQSSDMPLNMENYKGVGLEKQNLIVSTQTDQILKTMESHENISKEFKEVQNEIIANNEDAMTNADTVFNHLANNEKEEVSLTPLSEIDTRENIDIEILQKIRFFISNKYINPYSFKVDITSGIFYNVETHEVLEVRKDENTDQYHIYKGSEIVYGDNYQNEEQLDSTKSEPTVKSDVDEEEKKYEDRFKPKKRVLRSPQMNDYNNAAFSKMNFLVLIIAMFTISITFITLLSKFVK